MCIFDLLRIGDHLAGHGQLLLNVHDNSRRRYGHVSGFIRSIGCRAQFIPDQFPGDNIQAICDKQQRRSCRNRDSDDKALFAFFLFRFSEDFFRTGCRH